MISKSLMVVGTSSSVGKSILVTGLCRLFARRGVRVAPFKAQNMSNNAAVCPDGCEIGRAQAVQADAAGISPCVEMNPILLKPEADARSQVIVMGRAVGVETARSYYQRKEILWETAVSALNHMRKHYDLVLIEGAGSPVELNLKEMDIVNMAIARYADAPVLLAGDIDRGGIFAQLLGTLWLLDPEERSLIKGLIINKFRGDASLFDEGIRLLENRGGVPVVGVIPYINSLYIPEEDAVALDTGKARAGQGEGIDIVVIHLPHIANFDDFDPLAAEPGVRVRYVSSSAKLGQPRAVILPGTKSTLSDLVWLKKNDLAQHILELAATGTAVVGICGGYQMLGQFINDPEQKESHVDHLRGLGLLPHQTIYEGEKLTHRVEAEVCNSPGWLSTLTGQRLSGYEIHLGRTDGNTPWLQMTRHSAHPVKIPDGSATQDGRIWGCYLHGLFENENFRQAWLGDLGWQKIPAQQVSNHEAAYDFLADTLEESLDMHLLEQIIWGRE